MKEYDVTIQETLEMTVSVEAESREEARQMVADRWKNGEYTRTASRMWNFTPGTAAATERNDELFFRVYQIPQRGMECVCTSKHRRLGTNGSLLGGTPPNTPL